MQILILLPYKENYSPDYAGAVSIFVNSINKVSKFKSQTKIYGSTNFNKKLSGNYINLKTKRNIFKSNSTIYLDSFYELEKKNKNVILEIHNRPYYAHYLKDKFNNIVLYFHNDPNTMKGSKSINEKQELVKLCKNIIFNSNWSKDQFVKNLQINNNDINKLLVIPQCIEKSKVNLMTKINNITFVGKLNSAKGYDLFCAALIRILDNYKDWKATAIGDEAREKFNFHHKNLKILGFQNHKKVLKNFEKSKIAVVCSRWNEPFGRTSLEASSKGCAVIISNRGGLTETNKHGIILKNLTVYEIEKKLKFLIENKNELLKIQKLTLKDFSLDSVTVARKIDNYRMNISNNIESVFRLNLVRYDALKSLKILHVTNFNERHNGRLFYNTGRRINNGLIRNYNSVLEISDRDVLNYSRNLIDTSGSIKLNSKLIKTVENFVPNIIIFGHADEINKSSLDYIKNKFPNIKMAQWFLDRMDLEWIKNKFRFLDKIEFMDASFCTTDPKSLNISASNNVYYLPNPVDETLERFKAYENKLYYSDVFFALSHGVHRGKLKKNKFDSREIFIKKLVSKNPKINFDLFGLNNKQPIWAENFLNHISSSKIGINLSQGKPCNYYSSDRFSQIIGNGLLLMIDKKTKIGNFFNDDEIITYSSFDDLSYKIDKFTFDDKKRINIAKNGRKKYFKFFNSNIVADYIVKKTFGYRTNCYWEKFF